jgi:heme/copper-type cytochrome/quinol oxidase subunit 3
MKLFIISEVMFFFSFFLAYFYIAWSPSPSIGCVWPPEGIIPINPWALPAVNTALLLSSGVTVTWAHRAVVADIRKDSINGLGLTIFLGVIFTYFQYLEYNNAAFAINDGVYGSLFYIMTGFHGIHVIIGTFFLLVCWFRLCSHHFTGRYHLGLVFAIWYWHFVDVVWIALYGLVYIW